MATIEDVIEYCDRGGNPNPHLDENVKPLHLSAEEKGHSRRFCERYLAR